MMWLELGFIKLPADLGFWASVALLSEHAAVRATNHAIDEWRKKDKDDKEKKWWAKERAKLQRGKWRQRSSEEEREGEEEEEEDDDSGSPIPWDDPAGGDEGPPSPQAWPFPWHLLEQEGEDTPSEMVGASRPAPSKPSTVPPEPRGASGSASFEPPIGVSSKHVAPNFA